MAKRRQVISRVFVDSSVLFTAINSPSGGSAKLFTIKKIRLLVCKVVLAEVERNVRQKLRSYHLDRFFKLVESLEVVAGEPDKDLVRWAKGVIVEKDAVILAEAKRSKADFLVSLDKKHLLTREAGRFLKPKRVVTPKMLFGALGI